MQICKIILIKISITTTTATSIQVREKITIQWFEKEEKSEVAKVDLSEKKEEKPKEEVVEEIKEANLSENSYIRDHYYIHWLRALERICNDKGLLSSTEITTREEDWRRAYLNTEHGKPVALEAAFNNMQSSPDHKHEL